MLYNDRDNNKSCDGKRPNRLPMKIDEQGNVVFVDPPREQMDFLKPQPECKHKNPTPLMLCNEISKMFSNAIRESTQDQRIRGSYREILFHLSRCDGRNQLELAKLTHLKPPTVSVALQKLEDEGYVTREADPMDQRRTKVFLTDKGKQIDEKARTVIHSFDDRVSKGFSEEEMKQLMVLLFRMRENIAEDENE